MPRVDEPPLLWRRREDDSGSDGRPGICGTALVLLFPVTGARLGGLTSETSLSRLVLWLFANPLLRFDDLIELRLVF